MSNKDMILDELKIGYNNAVEASNNQFLDFTETLSMVSSRKLDPQVEKVFLNFTELTNKRIELERDLILESIAMFMAKRFDYK